MAAATRTPFESSRRVFVIEGADTMNDQAANRMLKTLEEPPPFVHLVLLTDRREDVLPTIASRCQAVRFDPLPPARIAARLEDTEPERAQACARLALGDARLAARLASEEGQASAGGRRGLRALRPERRHRRAALDRAARRRQGRRRGRGRGRGRAPGCESSSWCRARSANATSAKALRPVVASSAGRARRRSISRCAWRSCGCATCCASPKARPSASTPWIASPS